MSRFSVSRFNEMLSLVNRGRDSIHAVTEYVCEHKSHCFEIVEMWLRSMRRADVDHKLTLFYVANDIVQQCKRRSASEFLEGFANILETAVALASDDLIKDKIMRTLEIWEDRGVYHPDFVNSLKNVLIRGASEEHTSAVAPETVEPCQGTESTTSVASENKIQESGGDATSSTDQAFQCHYDSKNLSVAMEELRKITSAVRKLKPLRGVENIDIDIDTIPAIAQGQGEEMLKVLDSAVTNSNMFITAIAKEVSQRKTIVEEAEKIADFYTRQQAAVEEVDVAYKHFWRKLKRHRKQVYAKKSELSSSNGSANKAAVSTPSGASAVREKTSCSSISSLDQRLSLLTQDSSPHQQEIDFSQLKLICSSPPEETQVAKSPVHYATGCKPSPSQSHSACEGYGRYPQVDPLNMDTDNVQCKPVSSKGGETSDTLKTAVVSPVTPSAITKAKTAIGSPVTASAVPVTKAKTTMGSPVGPSAPEQFIDLVESNSTMSEDLNEFPVQFINLPGTKCGTQSSVYLCDVKNSSEQDPSEQDHTEQQLPSSSCNSERSPSAKSRHEEDIEIVFVAPKSSKMNIDSTEPHTVSQVNSKSPNEFVSANLQRNEKSEMQIQNTSDFSLSEHQESSLVVNGDDEVMIVAEQPKVTLNKTCNSVRGRITCERNCFVYHMKQTLIAWKRMQDRQLKAKPKIGSVKHALDKEIINIYSLLQIPPSRRSGSMQNSKNEPDVIVISDEPEKIVEERFGNSSYKIRRQLTSRVEIKQGSKLTEDLEVMDMDLGSSDEEKM